MSAFVVSSSHWICEESRAHLNDWAETDPFQSRDELVAIDPKHVGISTRSLSRHLDVWNKLTVSR